ncbi:MAG: VOC family protein [Candidatus Gastranaerophilales bacterium]|nr:VOC family protein [Candidatus Gastranaerophilales bacterium]
MKFLHSMIRVKDIDKSLRFYMDFLGLKLISKNSLEDCDLYFLGENENTCQIELTYNYKTPINGYENGNSFGHFAFGTKDMEKTSLKVKEMGYEFLYAPFTLDLKDENGSVTPLCVAFIKDPDGNEIELIQKDEL